MPKLTSESMSIEQFERLRKLIYDRTGIHFADRKKYLLESRMGQRLVDLNIDNYDQYLALLTTGPYRDEEFQEMCDRITINETSFFRNTAQLEYFESHVLARLIEARASTKKLRIWSAACSSGEEPYTLAIILKRMLGVRIADWRVEILGTDLSEKVLAQAQAGRYTPYAVRTMSDLERQASFTEDRGAFVLDPQIKQMVHFARHNLRDRFAAKRFGSFDVIFCRNVMIYFDDVMRENCFATFHDQIADDGELFIGHSEKIQDTNRFLPIQVAQSFAYEKTRGEGGSPCR